MSDYDEVEKARLTAKYERHIKKYEEMIAAINAMFGFHIITIEQKDELLFRVRKRLQFTRGRLHTMCIPVMSQEDVDSLNARIAEDIKRRNNV
jgi:hypothetical protein